MLHEVANYKPKKNMIFSDCHSTISFQINMGTSWIDGSFVYSTSETWVNTMRSFKNGTFRASEGKLPPRNKERVPLFNSPPARYLGIMSPERMFSKFHDEIERCVCVHKCNLMHWTMHRLKAV